MRYLVYSHVFIAICALVLTLETILVYKLPIDKLMPYLGLVFYATLMTYSAKSIQCILIVSAEDNSDRSMWISHHKTIITILFLLSVVMVVFFAFWMTNKLVLLLLLSLSILSLGYSFPFKIGTKKIVLREVPFLKTVLVAIVWSIVVACIPFVESGVSIVKFRVLEMFLFLLSLAILFDIKDISLDEKMHLKTIPIKIGMKGTKALSMGLLLSWGLLVFGRGEELGLVTLLLSCIFAIFIMTFVKLERREFFYMFWIDGLMIVKASCLMFMV